MSRSLFTPELRSYLKENDVLGLKMLCETLQPTTVAETLEEALTDEIDPISIEQAWHVLSQSGIREQAEIFEYLPIELQVEMVRGTGAAHMARLIEQMAPDDRVDLLQRLEELDERTPEDILRLVDEAARRDIKQLLDYDEGTVGAIMTTDYAWLPAHLTTTVAIDRLRRIAPKSETIYYIYVLEEPSRRLLGVVSLRDLILAPRQATLNQLMETDLITLRASDDQNDAVEALRRSDLLALPVVDEQGRLVGIVTHDDVIDAAVEEATRDMQLQGAVAPITHNYLEAPFFEVWRKRVVWLALLFIVGIGTSFAMANFQDTIAKLVVLSLFVPLCISVGGNSGSQAATLITRALSLGHVGLRDWFVVLRHELLMGAALGLALAALGFARGYFESEDTRSGTREVNGSLVVRFPPTDEPPQLQRDRHGHIRLPEGAIEALEETVEQETLVVLPDGQSPTSPRRSDRGDWVVEFPPGCKLRTQAVSGEGLGLVIAGAVAVICLWGTLVGAMLPLFFERFGIDPALASSAFVATLVDVTGIILYFTIASLILL